MITWIGATGKWMALRSSYALTALMMRWFSRWEIKIL